MRRRAIGESLHEEAKLFFCLFRSEAQMFKHQRLQFSVVDTDGSSSHLDTIEHKVIRIRPYLPRIAVQKWYVFRLWRGKWMVHRMVSSTFFIPFEQWKVDDP